MLSTKMTAPFSLPSNINNRKLEDIIRPLSYTMSDSPEGSLHII